MTTECVLAIDLGTGGPKVALVGVDGSTVAWSSRSVATRLTAGGGAEQDPHEMWSAIVVATRTTMAAIDPVPPVVAVAVTSQYMSTIPVAADGMPTGPCVLWMDTRGADHNTAFGQLVCDNRTWGLAEYDPELVAATGLDPDKPAPLAAMNGIVAK